MPSLRRLAASLSALLIASSCAPAAQAGGTLRQATVEEIYAFSLDAMFGKACSGTTLAKNRDDKVLVMNDLGHSTFKGSPTLYFKVFAVSGPEVLALAGVRSVETDGVENPELTFVYVPELPAAMVPVSEACEMVRRRSGTWRPWSGRTCLVEHRWEAALPRTTVHIRLTQAMIDAAEIPLEAVACYYLGKGLHAGLHGLYTARAEQLAEALEPGRQFSHTQLLRSAGYNVPAIPDGATRAQAEAILAVHTRRLDRAP